MQSTTVRRQAGFTLIEALIAMLILAFGMLAVAGLQTTLAHNSDVAKQRTEATRLAQAKVEELRAFQQFAAASGVAAYVDIANGTDTPVTTTNTTYKRVWKVDDTTVGQKTVRVSVAWADRQQDPLPNPLPDPLDTTKWQQVTLSSVISRSDPLAAGALRVTPAAPEIKPASQHGMPPIPTVGKYIGGGKSAIQLPSGGAYIIFDNTLDATVFRCTGTVTATTDASSCTTPLSAFLVTGFISGLPSSFDNDTQALAMSLALAPGFSAATQAECVVGRIPPNSTFPRDPGSPAPSTFVAGFYAYVCLIQPVVAGTWSGSLQVRALTGSLMRTNDRICRLSWEQNGNTSVQINREHPDPYANVDESLQGQNFLYVPRIDATTPANCPAPATINGITVTYTSVNLIP